MAYEKIQALALAFPILTVAVAPDSAEACPGPDPCAGEDFWYDLVPVNAAKIPSDGVLVLQGGHQNGVDEDWLAKIELTVTKDGQPIAGALEATSQHGMLIWRPEAPWEAGATLQMTGKITNPPFDSYYECAAPEILFEADLVIDSEPGAPLGAVEFTAMQTPSLFPEVTLETLVCCPGAMPSTGYGGCYGESDYVYWDDEVCAPTVQHGYLLVEMTADAPTSGPALAQVIYTLKIDGVVHTVSTAQQFSLYQDKPFCAVIEAQDVASGKVSASAEQCFGQDIVDKLGVLPIAPPDALTCELENCASNGGWDPAMCTPFEPDPPPTTSDTMTETATETATDAGSSGGASDTSGQDGGEKGCACDVGPGGDAGLLALVGLLGLARRRRVRS